MGPISSYLDYSGRDDVLSGGVKEIPVSTPSGTYRVWTKRVGNNPALKLLLLHGGPGATHEYLEALRQLPPRCRGRVLLLRPAGVGQQRAS